jgi:hypothetical protein
LINMRIQPKAFVVLILCIGALSVACNFDPRPARAPVTGTVTYRGVPVANASVSFIPTSGEQIAMGITDPQGKFTLRTFELADGAIVGPHKVQIIARGPDRPLKPGEAGGSGLPGEMVPGDPTIPTKYFDAQTSGLTFTVTKAGPNMPTFDLKD